MTHGDLSPSNIYVADSGEITFLDREWTGASGNKLLALIYDYGNLRARSWNNKEFRETLDDELKKQLGDEAGKTVISLRNPSLPLQSCGILRKLSFGRARKRNRNPEKTRNRRRHNADVSIHYHQLRAVSEIAKN